MLQRSVDFPVAFLGTIRYLRMVISRVVETGMGRWHFYTRTILGGIFAVLGPATFLSAAALDLTGPKETTKKLTARNISALMGVSTAVPEDLHPQVIEVIQTVESSRERIIHVLDRIESGLFPSAEGMERARTIAQASAQREKEFLEALMKRVPPGSVPKVEEALTVSAESWQKVLSTFHLPKVLDEEPDLPQRPGFDLRYTPIPLSPPARE